MVVLAEEAVNQVEIEPAQSPDEARFQHPSTYVSELRTLIAYYIGRIDQEYADTPSGDDNAFSVIQKDGMIQHVMNLRSLYVAGEYTEVTSKNFPEVARIANRAFSYIDRFTQARKSLAYNGALYGSAIMKKYWKKVSWPDYPGMTWIVPCKVSEVDRRRLRIERDGKDRSQTYWTMWDPHTDRYLKILDRDKYPNYQPGFTLQDFCWYLFDQEESFPFGRGLAEVLYPMAYRKKFANIYWDDLCESHSGPHLQLEFDPAVGSHTKDLGDGLPTKGGRIRKYLTGLQKMKARHAYAIPKHDKLRIVENGSVGTNVIRERIDNVDAEITLVVLANELTTQSGGSSSSFALGQVHKGGENTTVVYDRTQCDEVWGRDLCQDFFWRNRDNFALLGYPQLDPYQYQFFTRVTNEEIKKEIMQKVEGAQVVKLANTMG